MVKIYPRLSQNILQLGSQKGFFYWHKVQKKSEKKPKYWILSKMKVKLTGQNKAEKINYYLISITYSIGTVFVLNQ